MKKEQLEQNTIEIMEHEYEDLRDELKYYLKRNDGHEAIATTLSFGFFGILLSVNSHQDFLFLLPSLYMFVLQYQYYRTGNAMLRISSYLTVFLEPHLVAHQWETRVGKLQQLKDESKDKRLKRLWNPRITPLVISFISVLLFFVQSINYNFFSADNITITWSTVLKYFESNTLLLLVVTAILFCHLFLHYYYTTRRSNDRKTYIHYWRTLKNNEELKKVFEDYSIHS